MYRPLPNNVTIKSSEIDGLGLFATKDIKAEEVIGITHVLDSRWPDGYIRLPLGGFYNHSEKPNCYNFTQYHNVYQCKVVYIQALRDIKAGEEITCKYTAYDPTK